MNFIKFCEIVWNLYVKYKGKYLKKLKNALQILKKCSKYKKSSKYVK